MIRFGLLVFFVLANLWRFGWQSSANLNQDPQELRVIYGEDNRLDFDQIEDSRWYELAQSTVALFDQDDLHWDNETETYTIEADHFGSINGLCKDEPFYDQPSRSFCSGFLIDEDIVITAGHCLRIPSNCERARFVFGYSYRDLEPNPLEKSSKQVYHCQELIHSQKGVGDGADYAIVRLDRPVQGYTPLEVRESGQINIEDELTIIGYPKGLPGKLAGGGKIRGNTEEKFFVATLDAFGGNSGSAVFNSRTGLIEGLLARGEKDFGYDKENRCRRSYKCEETTCRGEDVVRISEILKHFDRQKMI